MAGPHQQVQVINFLGAGQEQYTDAAIPASLDTCSHLNMSISHRLIVVAKSDNIWLSVCR